MELIWEKAERPEDPAVAGWYQFSSLLKEGEVNFPLDEKLKRILFVFDEEEANKFIGEALTWCFSDGQRTECCRLAVLYVEGWRGDPGKGRPDAFLRVVVNDPQVVRQVFEELFVYLLARGF